MELTKEEMRLVITALNKLKKGWEGVNEEFVEDTKILIYKFENYLNRRETNAKTKWNSTW